MLVPYPDSTHNPKLKKMRIAANTLEKLLELLAIEVVNFDLLTWQIIKERYEHSGLGERALTHIKQQRRAIYASGQREHIGLWEFHIGLIYLHWGKPQQALECFATAFRYWELFNYAAASYLALFAQGYMKQFDRLYGAADAIFNRIQQNIDRLQRRRFGEINKEFIPEMKIAVTHAINDLKILSSQLNDISPNNINAEIDIKKPIAPSMDPPPQLNLVSDDSSKDVNIVPGHNKVNEDYFWYRIHRNRQDNFLPNVARNDWVLVKKSITSESIIPENLVVYDNVTMQSSIWLTNVESRESTANPRIFLGRMKEPSRRFRRDSDGNIQISNVQISEQQQAPIDIENIVGIVVGFWTEKVDL